MTEPEAIYFRRIEPTPGVPHSLGRNVKHDPASRRFAHPVTAVEDKPVEWPVKISPLDQDLPITYGGFRFPDGTGSCTGNAGTGDEATDAAGRPGVTSDPMSGSMLDEQYALRLYADATAIDDYQGTFPLEDTGSDGLSIAKVLKTRGLVDGYTHVLQYAAALSAIQGGPFITGTNWYDSMFDPDPDGVVTIADGAQVAGGHEYLVIGRQVVRGQLMWKFRNSWGQTFGDRGDFYMEDATYRRLLSEDGDATVMHWTTSAGPAPQPTPTPDPGAAPFPVDLDPDVATRVRRAAARAGVQSAFWVNNHFRNYFRI